MKKSRTIQKAMKRKLHGKRFKHRKNPESKNAIESMWSHVLPGTSAFLATTTITGRVESIAAGKGIFKVAGLPETSKQKVAALAVPAAMLLGAFLLTKYAFKSKRVPVMVGVGSALAYKVVAVLFAAYKSKLGLNGSPTTAKVSGGTSDATDSLQLVSNEEPLTSAEVKDLQSGNFEQDVFSDPFGKGMF